jgi:hypothetical protein
VPAASLDADDPLDEENSDDPDSDDDTAQLLAELQRIKKERSMEQAKRVSRDQGVRMVCSGGNCVQSATIKGDQEYKKRVDPVVMRDAVWRKDSMTLRYMDTGNSYSKYLKIPPEDQLIWPLCFTKIWHAVDDTRKVAQ